MNRILSKTYESEIEISQIVFKTHLINNSVEHFNLKRKQLPKKVITYG